MPLLGPDCLRAVSWREGPGAAGSHGPESILESLEGALKARPNPQEKEVLWAECLGRTERPTQQGTRGLEDNRPCSASGLEPCFSHGDAPRANPVVSTEDSATTQKDSPE